MSSASSTNCINIGCLPAIALPVVTNPSKVFSLEKKPFTATDWTNYCKILLDAEPKYPNELVTFWNGPDPFDCSKLVSETHIPPVYRAPFRETDTGRVGGFKYFSLEALRKLGMQFAQYWQPALKQNLNLEAKNACWLIMREDVVARGETFETQTQIIRDVNKKAGTNYEIAPSVIDIATVIYAQFLKTGKYYLGASDGVESRWTATYCKEVVEYKDEGKFPITIGSYMSAGANISLTQGLPAEQRFQFGLAALHIFKA